VVQAPQRGVHMLYTAGEEKLIRVFDAPNSVLRGLEKLCGISMSNNTGASRYAACICVFVAQDGKFCYKDILPTKRHEF
jgi:hypothetical protein